MIIVADTSGLLATYSRHDPHHQQCSKFFNTEGREFVYSPMIMTEFDHLIRARTKDFSVAQAAFRTFIDRVNRSDDEFATLTSDDYANAIDLADALGVVIAARYGTNQIFTLDEKNFRRLSPLDDHTHFELLPTDDRP